VDASSPGNGSYATKNLTFEARSRKQTAATIRFSPFIKVIKTKTQ